MHFFFGLLLFALCFSGYALQATQQLKIKIEQAPLLVFAGWICVLFFAGLLNCLLAASLLLFLCGIGFLVYSLVSHGAKKRQGEMGEPSPLRLFLSPKFLFFVFFCLLALFLLRGAKLVHYDNFSHWGTLAKQMALENRLPNFLSKVTQFPSYPPGSALFIFFFTKFVGFSDAHALMGQAFLLIACLSCLLSFFKTRQIAPWLLSVAAVFFLLTLNHWSGPFDLLVDTLLPLFGLGEMAILLFYRNQFKKACLLSLPLSIATILIKTSGLFFFAVHVALLLFLLLRALRKKQKLPRKARQTFCLLFVLALLVPLGTQYLWKQHVKLVFDPVTSVSTHAATSNSFKKSYVSKTEKERNEIVSSFFKKSLDLQTKQTKLFLGATGFFLGLSCLMRLLKKRHGFLSLAYLFNIGIVFLYSMGLLFMYLFSMPRSEALVLASYARYFDSVLIYIIGVDLIFLFLFLSHCHCPAFSFLFCGLALLCMGVSFFSFHQIKSLQGTPYTKNHSAETVAQMAAFSQGIPQPEKHSYRIYLSEETHPPIFSSYLKYLCNYEFLTDQHAIVTNAQDQTAFFKKLQSADYLFVCEEEEDIILFLQTYAGQQENYLGRYRISAHGLKKER